MSDDAYKDRVAKAVMEAIWEAGRNPNGDTEIKLAEAVDAMAGAMVRFIFTTCAVFCQDDPQLAVRELETMNAMVQSRLTELIEAVADGSLRITPRSPPTLKVVT